VVSPVKRDGVFPYYTWDTPDILWVDGAIPVLGASAPQVISAVAQTHTCVRVTFSVPMLVDAVLLNPGNYVITGPTTLVINLVSVVAGSSDTQVDLEASDPFYGDSTYTVTVSNVTDVDSNVIDPAYNSATFLTMPKDIVDIIWVATTGNDSTGTGSQTNPYLTIDRALTDFERHSQIRIMDGTYTPRGTILISDLEGSIFAENPQGVTVQPINVTDHGAAISIIDSNRFSIQGINIIQSATDATHLIGIYAENVENFIAYTCSVSAFESTAGTIYGILAEGTGRIENCSVTDLACSDVSIYGIKSTGLHVIDCTVAELVGTARCIPYGIVATNAAPPPP
jgi:hypothetical protein